MQQIKNFLLTAIVFIMLTPTSKAQTIGNKNDLLNKTWRIMAMKCPEELSNANDPDQYVHYYGTLRLTPTNVQTANYGTYVRITRDRSDNPVEKGTYSLITDEFGGTRLILKSKGNEDVTYRVELVYPNHLTLVNMGDNAKCKFTYAIAP